MSIFVLTALFCFSAAVGCSEKQKAAPPAPPKVKTARPVQKTVTDYLEAPGNLQSHGEVDLVARVEGYLQSIDFEDGAIVKKGQLLFVIEQEPYEATLQQQEANAAQQKSTLIQAQEEYERQLRLIKRKATSESTVEQWRAAGESIVDAAVTASRRRLRPILMTSLAFVFGVIPLFVATGAGAGGRRDIGTAVIGGMLASTLLAMLFVPVFFVVFQGISEWWVGRNKEGGSARRTLAKPERPKSAKSVPTKKAPAAKKPAKPTATDRVLEIVNASRKGIDIATLVEKTGFSAKKIRSILSNAYKKGRIKRIGRGVYVGSKADFSEPAEE